MNPMINERMLLMIVGIIQPASAAEILGFLETQLPQAGAVPTPVGMLQFIKSETEAGHLMRVSRGEIDLHSLTVLGNRFLSDAHRKFRDKYRFYLLRDAHAGRFLESEDDPKGLAGVSPALVDRQTIKGSAANISGQRVPSGRIYWPRISRQFDTSTGSSASSSDTFLELLSFSGRAQLSVAARTPLGELEFRYEELGASIGVSPKILSQLANHPDRHYRSFEIPKRSGGFRQIESPRTFMKVTQWFIVDYLLNTLPVHEAVHSFRNAHSVLTNAEKHTSQKFVAGIDISNFYGSITVRHVFQLLQQAGFKEKEAALISRLCTKNGVLPQGAPTSPTLSNAVLYGFDEEIVQTAAELGIRYTRYADDITFSGDSRDTILEAIAVAREKLLAHNLHLNDKKTRIVSYNNQQRVTGVVVNFGARPPRKMRRNVRAALHNASTAKHLARSKLNEIQGSLSYFSMFPDLAETNELTSMKSRLQHLLDSSQKSKRPHHPRAKRP